MPESKHYYLISRLMQRREDLGNLIHYYQSVGHPGLVARVPKGRHTIYKVYAGNLIPSHVSEGYGVWIEGVEIRTDNHAREKCTIKEPAPEDGEILERW
jgi:hypothetical protein